MTDEGTERMFIALSNSITKLGDDLNLKIGELGSKFTGLEGKFTELGLEFEEQHKDIRALAEAVSSGFRRSEEAAKAHAAMSDRLLRTEADVNGLKTRVTKLESRREGRNA